MLGKYKFQEGDYNHSRYMEFPCGKNLEISITDVDDLLFIFTNSPGGPLIHSKKFPKVNHGKFCKDSSSTGGVRCQKNKYKKVRFVSYFCSRDFFSGIPCILPSDPIYSASLNKKNILEVVEDGGYQCLYQAL